MLGAMASRVSSARPLYHLGARWYGPSLYSNTRGACEDLSDRRIRVTIEILPGYRDDGGIPKFPCLLYVDAFNDGAQPIIEAALNVAVGGHPPGYPVPNPAAWDRYDYLDASWFWNAPLARQPGGNNGVTLHQLLGYRCVLLNTGTFGPGAMEPEDFTLLSDWLTAVHCDGNAHRQGGGGADLGGAG